MYEFIYEMKQIAIVCEIYRSGQVKSYLQEVMNAQEAGW
jgi:hypothetical protein